MLSLVGTLARFTFPLLYGDWLYEHSRHIKDSDNRLKKAGHRHINHSLKARFSKLQGIYGLTGEVHLNRARPVNAHYVIENNFTVAIGNNFYEKAPKIIIFDSNVERLDVESSKFWLSYACSQLKNNDAIIKNTVLLVINLAAAFFCGSLLTTMLVGVAAHVLIQNTLGTYFAKRAYSDALNNATEEELKGALRLLQARIEVEKELSVNYLSKGLIWFRHLLYGNPSLESRKVKAEAILKNKFQTDDIAINNENFFKLKKYLLLGERESPRTEKFQKQARDLGKSSTV